MWSNSNVAGTGSVVCRSRVGQAYPSTLVVSATDAKRGSRGVEDVAAAAHVRDLLALQDHLGYERISLRIHGIARTGIRYAATHPDRVSSLILSSPSVSAADPNQVPTVTQKFTALAGATDWRLFARVFAVSLAGWGSPETSWFAKLIETGTDPSDFYRTAGATHTDDVDTRCSCLLPPLLDARDCPTCSALSVPGNR